MAILAHLACFSGREPVPRQIVEPKTREWDQAKAMPGSRNSKGHQFREKVLVARRQTQAGQMSGSREATSGRRPARTIALQRQSGPLADEDPAGQRFGGA